MKEYWLVFPEEKAIEVMTLEDGIYRELCSAKKEGTVRAKLIQGFEVELKGVFRSFVFAITLSNRELEPVPNFPIYSPSTLFGSY